MGFKPTLTYSKAIALDYKTGCCTQSHRHEFLSLLSGSSPLLGLPRGVKTLKPKCPSANWSLLHNKHPSRERMYSRINIWSLIAGQAWVQILDAVTFYLWWSGFSSPFFDFRKKDVNSEFYLYRAIVRIENNMQTTEHSPWHIVGGHADISVTTIAMNFTLEKSIY